MDSLNVRLQAETFFDKEGKFVYSKAFQALTNEFKALADKFDALAYCADTDFAKRAVNRQAFSLACQRAIAALRAYDAYEDQSVLVESEMVRDALLKDYPIGALMADVYEDEINE